MNVRRWDHNLEHAMKKLRMMSLQRVGMAELLQRHAMCGNLLEMNVRILVKSREHAINQAQKRRSCVKMVRL